VGASKKKSKQDKPAPAAKVVREVGPPADVSTEYKRLLVMWVVALLITAGMFFVAYRWLRPNLVMGEGRPQLMLIVLAVVALGEFAGSIWLWRNVMIDAERRKDLWLAQKGYLTAWLLCLAAGPLGYVIAKSDDGRFYYGFFILAALGVLYHQPARDLLTAAAPRVVPKKESEKPAETIAATAVVATETDGADDAATASDITGGEINAATEPAATDS
jgi:hypothetical protein